ncbi:BlaI/MecI/CopY family transcriptional regulator [Clostridium sp.]|uniref:BlaI/MecI/CopY family transcriptional regulator n=1 Tax=Clostridium sp. TaxID=1506 RepID=UPI0039F4A511
MTLKKIPESELEIMKVIWSNKSPISSKEIVEIMHEKKEWKNTTTLTLLSRLLKKNFINAAKEKRVTYYTPIVSEKDYIKSETTSFFKKFHNNSLKNFISTLRESNTITDEDLDELEQWIKNR